MVDVIVVFPCARSKAELWVKAHVKVNVQVQMKVQIKVQEEVKVR